MVSVDWITCVRGVWEPSPDTSANERYWLSTASDVPMTTSPAPYVGEVQPRSSGPSSPVPIIRPPLPLKYHWDDVLKLNRKLSLRRCIGYVSSRNKYPYPWSSRSISVGLSTSGKRFLNRSVCGWISGLVSHPRYEITWEGGVKTVDLTDVQSIVEAI